MLATFVIGLREGLEAALIVGIIAAFLRRNGKSVIPMWCGVIAAIILSAAVGVTLKVVESNLDQATQEGMETVIGAVAVGFVTSMVLWMRTNARTLKRELEGAAGEALADGTSRALVAMAFLAVLKEGFETAVFLLATFQASSNVASAATGSLLGVIVAAALGYGLYRGGVRIDLAKFFKATSVFLLLVAAGLVVNALRTAHEAGWLNAGQGSTFDLSWFAPGGSIRGALLTGVLGIPAQPRVIEVIGWLAYVVPLGCYLYLPQRLRPGASLAQRLRLAGATACAIAAAGLFLGVDEPEIAVPAAAPLVGGGDVRLEGTTMVTRNGDVYLTPAGQVPLNGLTADAYGATSPLGLDRAPGTLSVEQLRQLGGGRLPVGIDPSLAPGPYHATWTGSQTTDAHTWRGHLVDASSAVSAVVTVRGGGLASPRTVTLAPSSSFDALTGLTADNWSVTPEYTRHISAQIAAWPHQRADAELWRTTVPTLLLLGAAALLIASANRARTDRANALASAAKTAHDPGVASSEVGHRADRATASRTSTPTHGPQQASGDHPAPCSSPAAAHSGAVPSTTRTTVHANL